MAADTTTRNATLTTTERQGKSPGKAAKETVLETLVSRWRHLYLELYCPDILKDLHLSDFLLLHYLAKGNLQRNLRLFRSPLQENNGVDPGTARTQTTLAMPIPCTLGHRPCAPRHVCSGLRVTRSHNRKSVASWSQG